MDGVLRERQDDPESNQCDGSPVSGSASSHEPAATQRILLKEETADASKETVPTPSEADSTSASPTSTSPITSSSISIPPQSTTSTSSPSDSKLPSPSQPQASPSSSSASNPETTVSSVVSSSSASSTTRVEVSESSTISQARGSSQSVVTFSSSSSSRTSKQQDQPTRASSLDLPGLAAIAPADSSKDVDIEAVPATSIPTTASPSGGSAGAAPASTTTFRQEEGSSSPLAAPLASDPASQGSTLQSEVLKPQPTEPISLSPAPSAPTTDATSTPSLTIFPSTSASVTESTAVAVVPTGTGSSAPKNGDLQLQSSGGSNSSPPTGMIVGGVIGGAAALGVIALLLWLWKRRSQKKKQIGQPLTPLSYGPGSTPSEDMMGRFAGDRRPWTRFKNHAQGWWTSHGVGHKSPFARSEYDEKRGETVPLQQPVPVHTRQASLDRRASLDPFSDAHSTEAVGNAITPQQQQQRLRGILKQPDASASHSRHPSESVPFIATGAARRSRAHSISGQRALQANNNAPPRIPASRRTSSLTIDPFGDRRNKFRSDPFDLEIDTRMLSTTATAGSSSVFVSPSNVAAMPQPRDPRASSIYSSVTGSSSSRYTSGVSNGGNWGDLGMVPVVGLTVAPLALGGNRPGATDSPTLPQEAKGDRSRNGVVGQAF